MWSTNCWKISQSIISGEYSGCGITVSCFVKNSWISNEVYGGVLWWCKIEELFSKGWVVFSTLSHVMAQHSKQLQNKSDYFLLTVRPSCVKFVMDHFIVVNKTVRWTFTYIKTDVLFRSPFSRKLHVIRLCPCSDVGAYTHNLSPVVLRLSRSVWVISDISKQ